MLMDSSFNKSFVIGGFRISSLLFADDAVLLPSAPKGEVFKRVGTADKNQHLKV